MSSVASQPPVFACGVELWCGVWKPLSFFLVFNLQFRTRLTYIFCLLHPCKNNHNTFHEFLDKTIQKGKLVIDVKYFFFYVHSETRDICGETTCPATGDFVLSHQQTLPGFTPPVRFSTSPGLHI